MTSLTLKGTFELAQTDNNAIRLGINLAGLTSPSNVQQSIIKAVDGSGTTLNETFTGVSSNQQALFTANDQVYERMRLAWIKLRFIPKYNSFIQTTSSGSSAIPNQPVYIVSDSSGLETAFQTLSTANILANNTGIRVKNLYRPFKIFHRCRSTPYAPKYQTFNGDNTDTSLGSGYTVSGQWVPTRDNSRNFTGNHIAVLATGLEFDPDDPIFDVVFEMKFQWADRRSV